MVDVADNSLFPAVESALELMGCDIGAAECHGMLCGMLCGVRHFDASLWLRHTTGYDEELDWSDLGAGHALVQLLEETVAGFSSEDFSLRMLLPDEDESIGLRKDALGGWCRGFLSGFGLADLMEIEQLSEDGQEYLRDLQQIGRVDATDSEDDGDDFALMEICEYARMGALMLCEETHSNDDADANDTKVH